MLTSVILVSFWLLTIVSKILCLIYCITRHVLRRCCCKQELQSIPSKNLFWALICNFFLVLKSSASFIHASNPPCVLCFHSFIFLVKSVCKRRKGIAKMYSFLYYFCNKWSQIRSLKRHPLIMSQFCGSEVSWAPVVSSSHKAKSRCWHLGSYREAPGRVHFQTHSGFSLTEFSNVHL